MIWALLTAAAFALDGMQAIPCPDGIAGCTVLHMAPAPVVGDGMMLLKTPEEPQHDRFKTDPIQPCELCQHYGITCTNQIERHHLVNQSTLKALGLPVNDERYRVFLCDCAAHRCHLIAHNGDYRNDNAGFVRVVVFIRQHKGVK